MEPLRELPDVRQVPGEARRRWFSSPDLDLIVWFDESETIVGFQLCYDKSRRERALTWRALRGYDHYAIDDGESSPGQYKATPILVADGKLNRERLSELFLDAGTDLPEPIRATVQDLINGYSS